MDLKNTINNTNTQKENIKIVATNIDNKLVELGGEQATDLNDVPNKMQKMVDNYKKIAIIEKNINVDFRNGSPIFTIPINLEFVPTRILAHITNGHENDHFADTKNKDYLLIYYNEPNGVYKDFRAYIKNFDKNNIVFSCEGKSWQSYLYENVGFEILAIG